MITPSAPWQIVLALFQEVRKPPLHATLDDLVTVFARFEQETGSAIFSLTEKLGDKDTIRSCLKDELDRLVRDERLQLFPETSHYELIIIPDSSPGRRSPTSGTFLLQGEYLPLSKIGRDFALRSA